MAELNTGGGGGKKGGGKVRSKKQNSKVDLTAMVDLAFLLITFFMLTTTLSKPQSMNLGLPDKAEPDQKEQDIKVDENRTMTILLGFLYLIEVQLNRCWASKYGNGDSEFAFVVIDIFHVAMKICKRPFLNSNCFTNFK